MFVVKWLLLLEMDLVTQIHIPDKTICISHGVNTLRKGMNPIILSPAMDE